MTGWTCTLVGAATMAALPCATAVASASHGDEPARAVAERAAAMLETRYVDPAKGRRYAAALRDHVARGDYDAISDPEALARRLTTDVQQVAPDGHLRFHRSAPPGPPGPPGPSSGASVPAATGILAAKWIEPRIAYLAFDHFDDRPEAVARLERFLTDHGAARALIIDSRNNGGGAFDMLGLLGNRLFAAPRPLANMDMAEGVVASHGAPFPIDGKTMRRTAGPAGLVRFQHWANPAAATVAWSRVPVYYLTSRRTFSAAEHLAMVLKSTGRATLIGERTGGGNHFGGTEPVGGGLEMFVPAGHTTDPATGRDWEGVGVNPDIAVPADETLDEALRRIRAAD